MRAQSGFTLIELVMVIVLGAIVSVISVQFITYSTSASINTAERQRSAVASVVISEQISRALREALPGSVRTNGSCIEWIPTIAGSSYLDLPQSSAEAGFTAVPLANNASASGRIAVYGYGQDLYQISNPGPVSPPATLPSGTAPVTVSFDGGAQHRFSSSSPQQRFFVIGDPRTFCQQGSFLYQYSGYGYQGSIASSLPSAMPDRQVLAAGLVPGSVDFRVTPATLQRNAVVGFSLQLVNSDGSEVLSVSQEVQIRNVP